MGNAACLAPLARVAGASSQPEKAFGAQQALAEPLGIQQVVEFLRVKGAASVVGEAANAVLFGFGDVFAT